MGRDHAERAAIMTYLAEESSDSKETPGESGRRWLASSRLCRPPDTLICVKKPLLQRPSSGKETCLLTPTGASCDFGNPFYTNIPGDLVPIRGAWPT
jgi:hypothetical protein